MYFSSSSKKHEDPTVPQDVEDVTVGEDTSSVAVEVIEDNHERSVVASSENNSAEVDVKISSMVATECWPLIKSKKKIFKNLMMIFYCIVVYF